MNERSTIERHSLSEISAMRERGEDTTSPDAPEAESLGAAFWSSAQVRSTGTPRSARSGGG
jgi:hypothetical protein